jgi:valyl-tRNA synthetase
MTPQILGKWQQDDGLYRQVFPFTLRPQAHDIIRTWAFYTIVKAWYHFGTLPWKDVVISGWGIAGEGMGKISKSRGGGPISPLEMIERYSADAVRYWTSSTSLGKDAVISEEKMQMGARLVTKLWNVSRFAQRFLVGSDLEPVPELVSSADRWILARLQNVIQGETASFQDYDYASAKSVVESFFWNELADNYLEMCKQRLYGSPGIARDGAVFTLCTVLATVLKLFAPFFPYITEEIYQGLMRKERTPVSIHLAGWPRPEARYIDKAAEKFGEALVGIATTARRFKSERNLPLGSEINRVKLAAVNPADARLLQEALADLQSVTRARDILILDQPELGMEALLEAKGFFIQVEG